MILRSTSARQSLITAWERRAGRTAAGGDHHLTSAELRNADNAWSAMPVRCPRGRKHARHVERGHRC